MYTLFITNLPKVVSLVEDFYFLRDALRYSDLDHPCTVEVSYKNCVHNTCFYEIMNNLAEERVTVNMGPFQYYVTRER